MPTSIGHHMMDNGAKWSKGNSKQNGSRGKKSAHSEILACDALSTSNSSTYLLVQDAYPCTASCDPELMRRSGTKTIVIAVQEDQGSYSWEHPTVKGWTLPVFILYQNGTRTYYKDEQSLKAQFGQLPAIPSYQFD